MEKSELIREFKVFDMELLMLKSNNFTTIMDACKMACRDQGQYNWIKKKVLRMTRRNLIIIGMIKLERKKKNEE